MDNWKPIRNAKDLPPEYLVQASFVFDDSALAAFPNKTPTEMYQFVLNRLVHKMLTEAAHKATLAGIRKTATTSPGPFPDETIIKIEMFVMTREQVNDLIIKCRYQSLFE